MTDIKIIYYAHKKFSNVKDCILSFVFSLYPSYNPWSCLYMRPTFKRPIVHKTHYTFTYIIDI